MKVIVGITCGVFTMVTVGCSTPSGVAAARRSPSPLPCVSTQLTSSGAGALSGPVPTKAGHAAGLVSVTNDSRRTCYLSVTLQIEAASEGRHTKLVATPDSTVEENVDLQPDRRIGFKITWSTSHASGHCTTGARLDVTVPPAKTVVPVMARTICGHQAAYSLLMQPPPVNPKDPGLLPSGI
ncbi:DUF4232 domain-containing protein [Actinomadura sp. DC4]|uniref:DUF4232 domain-containing protein n=1 Tax=Actinomadura sp. DC4 TaxID=3055069 RepID=UPI0025B12B6D|nr:DUF4232 domain-containing protein [Actinomadura sp. DC4]MDN3359976.1 DUF4232 domain-containing protein [Actinomadura sp. DC4]